MQACSQGALGAASVNKGSTNFVKSSLFFFEKPRACCIFISSKAPPVIVSAYGPVMHNILAITHYFGSKNVL